jgi:uncharacterized membrane protein
MVKDAKSNRDINKDAIKYPAIATNIAGTTGYYTLVYHFYAHIYVIHPESPDINPFPINVIIYPTIVIAEYVPGFLIIK